MPTNTDSTFMAMIFEPNGTKIVQSALEEYKRLTDGNVYLKFRNGSEYITHMRNVIIYK